MLKSTTHLKDASRFLSTTVKNGKNTVISTTCQRNSHSYFSIEQQQSNLYLLSFIPNYRRSVLIPFVRTMSSMRAMSTQPAFVNHVKKSNHSLNQCLHDSFKVFNLVDKLTIDHLNHAIQSRNADKAWSIFVTLASNNEIIPFSQCCSLYSLLKFAKSNSSTTSKIAKYRQRQLDQIVSYVQPHTSLDLFYSLVKKIPVAPYKSILKAIRAGNANDAWAVFYKFYKENKNGAEVYKLPRNVCLKLMLLIMDDKRLNKNQLKMRLQLIALHGAGVSQFDSRYLSASDLYRLAFIHQGYQNNNVIEAHTLIDEFVLGLSKKKKMNRADALDELVWRIINLNDLRKAQGILNTIFQQKSQINMEINEMVFINMMNAYRRKKDYHQSLKLFEQLLETGRKPSTRVFNAVLQVFSIQGLSDKATYIFEKMLQLDVQPDIATYTEMIRANSHAGHFRQCYHYYSKMIHNNIQPNIYIFSSLIDASARKNDIKSMLRWFQTMLTFDIQPNEIVITCILRSLLRQRYQYPTISDIVLQIAHHSSMTGVKTDAALYTILLKMQAESNGIEGALKIHKDMLENLVVPNTYTYTTLINVCGKNKKPDTAEKIFHLMQQSVKCKPNTTTYTAMMGAWLKVENREKLESLIYDFLVECKSDKTGRFWLDSSIRNLIKSRCC